MKRKSFLLVFLQIFLVSFYTLTISLCMLSKKILDEKMLGYLVAYGKVEEIEWPTDKNTKQRLNFAFIIFEDESALILLFNSKNIQFVIENNNDLILQNGVVEFNRHMVEELQVLGMIGIKMMQLI